MSPSPPPRKRTARTRAPTKLSPPLYKASVKDLAESGTIRVSSSTSDMDNAVLLRIKKCLERANHPTTPESEAKAALHLASRLMGQYNVTQAEVLAHESPSAQRRYAGQSDVSIRRVDGDKSKSVQQQSFVGTLGTAMDGFFDCKFYSTARSSSLQLTFYGIAENTVAAAISFEMAYNLIAEWARPHKGVACKNSYSHGISDELWRMSQREKVAEEAQAMEAERDAITIKEKQEEAERQAQLDRLASLPEPPDKSSSPEPSTSADISCDISTAPQDNDCIKISSDSESIGDDGFNSVPGPQSDEDDDSSEDCIKPDFQVKDEDNMNSFEDLDEEISKLIQPEPESSEGSFRMDSLPPLAQGIQSDGSSPVVKREPSPATQTETTQNSSKQSELGPDLESKWASRMQLITFRETATKIADEYLGDKGVKLRNSRAREIVIRDRSAYDQGVKDSRKIDVHRKTIKE